MFEKQPPQPLDDNNTKLLSQTPLHYACYRGDVEMVNALLGKAILYNYNEEAANACINAMVEEEDNINGWTPAHWAACYGQLTCLMRLHVRPSVGFDKSTERSNTSPLHLAAQSGAVLCQKWLIQCGAVLDRQDFMGETAIHKAAKAGNTDCAAMLVSHGATLELKNHRGSTPSGLALLSNSPALARLLRQCNQRELIYTPEICSRIAQHSLPISDLHLSSVPDALSLLHTPLMAKGVAGPDIKPENMYAHFVEEENESGGSIGTVSVEGNGCVHMNGEEIYQCGTRRHEEDDEFMTSESLSSRGCGDGSESGVYLSNCVGMKRSLDEDDMEDFDDVESCPNSKRQCFVPSCNDENRYGTAYNNNVLSSYNSVLAMRLEPLHATHQASGGQVHQGIQPPSSSAMEHQETVIAEQGYDSSLMNSFNNVFV